MAIITGHEVVTIRTNKGNLYFPIFDLDINVESNVSYSVSTMADGTSFYPLSINRSVWYSPPMIATEFESTNGRIKGYKKNSGDFYIAIYNEDGTFYTEYGAVAGANHCSCIGWTFFRGLNGVSFLADIAQNYALYPSGQTVDFVANTLDEFGSYSRPKFRGITSGVVSQYNINVASAILSARAPSGKPDPYSQGGASGGGGGTGRFSRTGDTIGEHNVPTLSATDAGFITLFAPTAGEMKALASYLWSDLFSIDTFKKIFANPMDAILGLSIVPVSVPTSGSASVKVGNISTGVSMTKASTQYVKLSCGSLEVEEYWGAYLDYSPYTKCEIYLPYIGVHELSIDDVMGKTVKVVYYIDILSGACTAEIYSNSTCLYSFVGQCSASIPITGNDWTNVINGVMQIGASIGSMVASGGLTAPISAGGVASGLKSVASASSTVTSSKPSVERSGSMSGAGGMLGQQTPYLIITWPKECIPENQNKYIGYPSFVTVNLGEIVGFNTIESVHLENIPATSAELDEIESLLMNGVIF